jgi:death-on-curing protein
VTRHLAIEQALRIARTAVGGPIQVRDIGLLESAVHRPRASVLGQDAYPDLFTKAAALLHSLAGNHPLVDGNKRLAWLATYVFLAKNGVELDPNDDAAAYDFVIAVAAGEIDDVGELAGVLSSWQAGAPRTLAGGLGAEPYKDLVERFGSAVPVQRLESIAATPPPRSSPAGTTDARLAEGRSDRGG